MFRPLPKELTIKNSPIEGLGLFATEDINLLRIESRPLRGQLWRYVFFIDCEGHIDDKNIQNAMNTLDDHDINVKILGCYPSYKSS